MVSKFALTNTPNQTINVSVPGDTRNLSLVLKLSYNKHAGYWILGIYDNSNNAIVVNIPIVINVNLLGQYQYLDIGSLALINTGDPSLNPDDANISNFVLVWKLV
jgi:hypothetical protein